MRRIITALAVAAALVLSPLPAMARGREPREPLIHVAGKDCRTHNGPDGSGGSQFSICVYTDRNDLNPSRLRAFVDFSPSFSTNVTVHVQFLRLKKNGSSVRDTGPFVAASPPADYAAGAYFDYEIYGTGVFNSKVKYYVCWPEFEGNPCGDWYYLETADFTPS